MRTASVWLGFLSVAVVAFAAGCGGGSGDSSASPTAAAQSPTASSAATPEAVAKRIYDDFVAMNAELRELLRGSPTAAQLKPKVAELKNRYIDKFVSSGRVRAKMSAADAAKVDAEFRRLLFAPPTIDNAALVETGNRLNATDPDLAQQLTSLNILTQYAFFELLKKQEPAEAARLGIE